MYHIVYLITNIVNNKIYVGVHSTYNPNDSYFGSGIGIKNAIKKYGKSKFNKQILYYCLTAQDAYQIESKIVDIYFVRSKQTYNQILGGAQAVAGFSYPGNTNPQSLEYLINKGLSKESAKQYLKEKGQKSIKTRLANDQIRTGNKCNFSKEYSGEEAIHKKNLKSATTLREKIKNGYLHGACKQSPKMIAITPKGDKIEFQGILPFAIKYNIDNRLIKKFLNKGPVILSKMAPKSSLTSEYINTIGWEFKTV